MRRFVSSQPRLLLRFCGSGATKTSSAPPTQDTTGSCQHRRGRRIVWGVAKSEKENKKPSSVGKNARSVPPQYRMYGVTPIWASAHRSILYHTTHGNEGGTPIAPPASATASGAQLPRKQAWLPVREVERLGLTITTPNAPRVPSPWGLLINGNATSDPAVLCLEVFQERRIPLSCPGLLCPVSHFSQMQQLMVEAPSEYPSSYWGTAAEFRASGATIFPDARPVEGHDAKRPKSVLMYNAGQTSNPNLFTPERCVAFAPYLIPELKFMYGATRYYWEVVRRGNPNCSSDWFSRDLLQSKGVGLKRGARCIGDHFYNGDLVDFAAGGRIAAEVRAAKSASASSSQTRSSPKESANDAEQEGATIADAEQELEGEAAQQPEEEEACKKVAEV